MLTDALEELDRLQREVEEWKKAASNFGCDCPIDLLTKHYLENEELIQLKQIVEEWKKEASRLGCDSIAELLQTYNDP